MAPHRSVFARRLNMLRDQADLSQGELASKLGCSQAHVSDWETDKSQPRLRELEKIAAFFGVSVASLAGHGNAAFETGTFGEPEPRKRRGHSTGT